MRCQRIAPRMHGSYYRGKYHRNVEYEVTPVQDSNCKRGLNPPMLTLLHSSEPITKIIAMHPTDTYPSQQTRHPAQFERGPQSFSHPDSEEIISISIIII